MAPTSRKPALAARRPVPTDLRSIGFELRRTDRAVEADLQARLASVGLQIGMWLYLRALWHEDGLTQSELSQRVGVSKPTVLDHLRRMEQRGLVHFERDSVDKRRVMVFLTPEGQALEAKLLPLAHTNHQAALAGFDAEEIEALYAALRRIRENVAGKRRHGAEAEITPLTPARRKANRTHGD